jgi:hypothetical protein
VVRSDIDPGLDASGTRRGSIVAARSRSPARETSRQAVTRSFAWPTRLE